MLIHLSGFFIWQSLTILFLKCVDLLRTYLHYISPFPCNKLYQQSFYGLIHMFEPLEYIYFKNEITMESTQNELMLGYYVKIIWKKVEFERGYQLWHVHSNVSLLQLMLINYVYRDLYFISIKIYFVNIHIATIFEDNYYL